MPDINKEASEFWNALKPMIDEEIKAQTRGMVQRRKMKVTTAPSLVSGVIGVTEPFGTEILIPFNTNLISASVGDVVWVEYMYGMSNAFASMFASADEKDMTVAGGLSVIGNAGIGGNLGINGNTTLNGVLDITPRRCEATLSSAGWYRAIVYNAYDTNSAQGSSGEIVTIRVVYTSSVSVQHEIQLFMSLGKVAFLNETSCGTTNIIDKIRYWYNGSVGYVDIHYNTSNSLYVNVSFDLASRNYAKAGWISSDLASVADSPSGTVLTTYDFFANTDATGAFAAASGVSASEVDIKRSGRNVYIHFYATGTFAAGTSYNIGTVTGVSAPSQRTRWLTGGGANSYSATTPVYATLSTTGAVNIYSDTAISVVNITISYIV